MTKKGIELLGQLKRAIFVKQPPYDRKFYHIFDEMNSYGRVNDAFLGIICPPGTAAMHLAIHILRFGDDQLTK